MKLVTFNIRCDYGQDGNNNFCYRKPMILDRIQREAPDVICFQEVLPHVAAWLKECLPDYYIIGCGRDEDLQGEQTCIAYKKSDLNLLKMDVFWLSPTPMLPGSRYPDQSNCPRTCTMALLQHLETKQLYRIYNTHLDHLGSEARRLGLSQILMRIRQEEDFVQAPAILAGDFNAFPNSAEMEVLRSYADRNGCPQLVDLTAGIQRTFHDFGRTKSFEKIDYIFIESGISCREVSLWEDCKDGVYLSDHYPVCADLMPCRNV
ncbi:endonuclease/exonuclease/phosphatase family metal-dependent hydrolase [Anaerotaenia torta]|uniref:endonuclease/exonuclease/phosphatase family protein n=1 Tax=Anaerotaenia torta TaxID=433293 RepID=UPI003D1A09ED